MNGDDLGDLLAMNCPPGTYATRDQAGNWRCKPYHSLEKWALIKQGDCDGKLVLRITFEPYLVNPAVERGPRQTMRSPEMGPVEVGLEAVAHRLPGLKTLKARLARALRGIVKPTKAKKAAMAKKARKAKASKRARSGSKPKAKAARRKK